MKLIDSLLITLSSELNAFMSWGLGNTWGVLMETSNLWHNCISAGGIFVQLPCRVSHDGWATERLIQLCEHRKSKPTFGISLWGPAVTAVGLTEADSKSRGNP